jgi:hypothetical protein
MSFIGSASETRHELRPQLVAEHIRPPRCPDGVDDLIRPVQPRANKRCNRLLSAGWSSLTEVFVIASSEGVAAITAGASLLAASGLAGVTVYTTRQRSIAERERLEATLAHERELSDLADLRQLLDEVMSAVYHATEIEGWASTRFDPRNSMFKERNEEINQKVGGELDDAIELLALLAPRLYLRLGVDDPITRAFSGVKHAMVGMRRAITLHSSESHEGKDVIEDAKAAHALMEEASPAFFGAAFERAGTQLPPKVIVSNP